MIDLLLGPVGLLGVIAAWFLLQVAILPRLGVGT